MSGARSKPRPRRRDNLHERKQDLLLAWSDEVCNNDEVPEVEIVSLLQEHIPKYRLRADSITQFGGYENQDWFIPSPALPVSDADLKLTPDQIRETLNYFRAWRGGGGAAPCPAVEQCRSRPEPRGTRRPRAAINTDSKRLNLAAPLHRYSRATRPPADELASMQSPDRYAYERRIGGSVHYYAIVTHFAGYCLPFRCTG
ncbi:hypothetical protein JYU34_007436 [Plutella xylostella]|uniref:HAP1 N-terminal domain-containing protein n=1 Tax=Plutella xylostella TaxID=51655 RepID=A0ABQ7QQG2_PLUXY|nr:hypothetical protein JYU34_007436 [Plutella xylostella]